VFLKEYSPGQKTQYLATGFITRTMLTPKSAFLRARTTWIFSANRTNETATTEDDDERIDCFDASHKQLRI
jgi:hypothetical protein